MISIPAVLFVTMRILLLLNNPDTVTRERWNLDWSFMSDLNSFIINVWPVDAVFGEDTRWRFYIAAIVNSARVTLLSIVLCTILGIFIGVMRLSSNKLASSMATVYVEVFRNLPLAVLLFLIATQLGETLPLFREEANPMVGYTTVIRGFGHLLQKLGARTVPHSFDFCLDYIQDNGERWS